jgi:hypothetical protein
MRQILCSYIRWLLPGLMLSSSSRSYHSAVMYNLQHESANVFTEQSACLFVCKIAFKAGLIEALKLRAVCFRDSVLRRMKFSINSEKYCFLRMYSYAIYRAQIFRFVLLKNPICLWFNGDISNVAHSTKDYILFNCMRLYEEWKRSWHDNFICITGSSKKELITTSFQNGNRWNFKFPLKT